MFGGALNISNLSTTDTAFVEMLESIHRDRESGRVTEAANSYESLASLGPEGISTEATLWMADVLMITGKISKLRRFDNLLLKLVEHHGDELAGDRYRLLGLCELYLFNPLGAKTAFDKALERYEQSGEMSKLELHRTNNAEVLAHIDPNAAITAADKAISAHVDTRNQVELGKSLTAKAWALLRNGRATETIECCDQAEVPLTEGQYDCGIARNNLVKGLAQIGERDTAGGIETIVGAVGFLADSSTYPSLVLLADCVLDKHGLSHPTIEDAAVDAQCALELPADVTFVQNLEQFAPAVVLPH